MDAVRALVSEIVGLGLDTGNWLGLVNLLIGRRIERGDGALISAGMTWRDLAALFKKLRWQKDAVREVGLNPKDLPPRDRVQFWFLAISRAKVDSEAARQAGERLAQKLREHGYRVV